MENELGNNVKKLIKNEFDLWYFSLKWINMMIWWFDDLW